LKRRLLPAAAVAAACAVNLFMLAGELAPVRSVNDSALHLSMIRWARARLLAGRLPFDGWYPYLSLGSAQFHHYQSLPHIITAVISVPIGPDTAYHWSLWLLLGLWPAAVYLGLCWMDLGPTAAAAAAIASPFLVSTPGYGFEHASYTWRGLGLWTQLWGMFLLPLALGATWRAVSSGRWMTRAAALLGALLACHFLTGYLALLMLPVWALVAPSVKRMARGAAVAVVGVAAVAWVVVPLAADGRWSGNLEFYTGTFWFDSFGPGKVLGWLAHGELLDADRLPVLTVFAALGLLVSGWRCRRLATPRAVLGLLLVSTLLFSGRSVVGPVVNLLPGGTDLPLHRYISGVQLASLALVGVAVEFLITIAMRAGARAPLPAPWRRPIGAAVAAAACLAALSPALAQLGGYDATGADMIVAQQAAEATDGRALDALALEAGRLGGGRVYAGTKGSWGHGFTVGQVPVYMELENLDVDAVGMWLNTESLASDVETRFNERDPGHFDLFGVAYEILPAGQPSTVPATLLRTIGRYSLWRVPSHGYVSVVDTSAPPIHADRHDIGPRNNSFLFSPAPSQAIYPVVSYDNLPAPTPSLLPGAPRPATPAGSVADLRADPAGGRFSAEVTAARPATVVLHSTFDPRWHVLVDGVDLPAGMIAPAFTGRTVPAGRHRVEFRYDPIGEYPALWLLGALALMALATRRGLRARLAVLAPLAGARWAILRPIQARQGGAPKGARPAATLAVGGVAKGAHPAATLAVFAAALAVYLLSAPGHLQTVDIRAEFAVAQSIAGRGDFTVNPNLPYVTVPSEPGIDGRRYSHHGLGQSLLMLPAAVVGQLAGCPSDPGLCPPDAQRTAEWAAGMVDPVCAALTVLVFFCLSRELGFALRPSLLATAALALGTAEWAYAHDTFDVVPDGLFLLAAIYLGAVALRRRQTALFLAAGLCAGFAVLVRLPTALLLPVLGLVVLAQVAHWPRREAVAAAVAWGGGAAACLLVLAWFNWARFGTPLESGYGLASDTYPFSTPLPAGLAGELLSPGKSIFLFSPALVLAVVGTRRFLARHRAVGLGILAMLSVHLCFYGTYQEWAGDWGWGPRYLVPLLPPAMLLALPTVAAAGEKARRATLAVGLTAAGAVVQLLDVLVDFQHQIQLKFDDGISLHSYWQPGHSALWRHAVALVQMLAGHGRYPQAYRFTDASLGLPAAAVPDTWWSYLWLDPGARSVAASGVLLLIVGLVVAGRQGLLAYRSEVEALLPAET
jgi:hypothetical protein